MVLQKNFIFDQNYWSWPFFVLLYRALENHSSHALVSSWNCCYYDFSMSFDVVISFENVKNTQNDYHIDEQVIKLGGSNSYVLWRHCDNENVFSNAIDSYHLD
jgi:transposase-like protein